MTRATASIEATMAKPKRHAERYDEFWQCEHAIQRQEAALIEDFQTQILRATRAIFKKCRTRSERVALAVALQNATYVTRWAVFHVEEAEEWLRRQLDTLG
jgi:hypothetical protein